MVCAGRGLIVAWGAVGCGWVGVGCVFGVEVEMVSGRVVAGCWFPVVVVLTGVGVVGATRLVADVAPLAVLRGVTQEIDFFWIALVVTQVNYVHRPRYKLQIYEEIAEKYYRSQKLCRRKVRNFFT